MVKTCIKSAYGNVFDIGDSIYLSSVGQREICNEALSFYNEDLEYGISYFVEPCMIVFQNDNYDDNYWTDERIKELEQELYKFQNVIDITNYNEISIDLDNSVNTVIDYMDNYCKYLINNVNDENRDKVNKILSSPYQNFCLCIADCIPVIKIGILNNKVNGKNIEKSFKRLFPLLSLFEISVYKIFIKRQRRIT